MTYFYLAAATLVFVALVLLLRPWWPTGRRSTGGKAGRTAAQNSLPDLNAAIHRDRLTELERDRSNGTLSAVDLAEAREELQRQLLDDTAATEVVTAGRDNRTRTSGIAIAILLPLAAIALYATLGSPLAVLPGDAQVRRASAEMDQLITNLEKKLAQNSANPEGWLMLARSYKSVGRWDDAERAFARIGPDLERNAGLLAELAETLAQKNNGFDDRSRQLIKQALGLEPANMLALFLGGTDAFDSGRYAEAVALWERLLPQLEAGGEDARMVESRIAQARERSGGPGAQPVMGNARPGVAAPQDDVHRAVAKAAQGGASEAATPSANSAATSVSGHVELSPALKAKASPDDVVFIFARAVDGPRVPLAAKRVRAADLPLDFVLDDSQAVMPGATISSAKQVRVEVRISKSGTAAAGKGDLTGKSAAVKPGAKGVRVVIDQLDP